MSLLISFCIAIKYSSVNKIRLGGSIRGRGHLLSRGFCQGFSDFNLHPSGNSKGNLIGLNFKQYSVIVIKLLFWLTF